jgi:hypothetical protein
VQAGPNRPHEGLNTNQPVLVCHWLFRAILSKDSASLNATAEDLIHERNAD